MASPDHSSNDPSQSSTPVPVANSRFVLQNQTAEDVLKSQTVGLVNLSDFRKRRVEALDGNFSTSNSGASTPNAGVEISQPPSKKPKKKAKAILSFGLDADDEDSNGSDIPSRSQSKTPIDCENDNKSPPFNSAFTRRSNTKGITGPKLISRAAQQREAEEKARLAKEFNEMQRRVKKTDIIIPFVFFDGSNTNGGKVRIKKEDQVWLFLDKARRMGAALNVGGERGRKEWARVNVNDLMLVRGDVIFPPHLEFYQFIINKTRGFKGELLFEFSDRPTAGTPEALEEDDQPIDTATYNPLSKCERKDVKPTVPDQELEGFDDDPKLTRVVDSRWYQRNKHIFPANTWIEYDPNKDFSKVQRTDAAGNTFFLS